MTFQPKRKILLATAVAFATQASLSHAAGYGINEQSASYLGTAFAGRGSNAIDAAISSSNPAGISFLEGTNISGGADLILEGGKFDGSLKPIFGAAKSGSTDGFQKMTPVPFGYFTTQYDDKWSFGLAGYAPYGIELDYDSNWIGHGFGNKTSVQVIALQGTASYKIMDNFAIGFGLIGSHVKGELTSTPFGASGKIEGDDNTVTWNIGALWQPTEQTAIGLAYHHAHKFKLKGEYSVANSPMPDRIPDGVQPAQLHITMPEKILFSVTQKLTNQWTVMGDVTWTRWSKFEEFDVFNPTTGNSQNYVPMNWRNTWAASIGTSYQLNDQILLRAGYMFDQSPVTDETRTVRSPDANRNWFTVGLNWKIDDHMDVDFAYAYVLLADGNITESKHSKPAKPVIDAAYGTLTGTYKMSSNIIGAQLNYKF